MALILACIIFSIVYFSMCMYVERNRNLLSDRIIWYGVSGIVSCFITVLVTYIILSYGTNP